ncbi:MAG: hypothetical protein M1457_10865 [bacterium]|nr:hypothetical protein [bacterium]
MLGLHILDIPIYRCTKEEYYREMDDAVIKAVNYVESATRMPLDRTSTIYETIQNDERHRLGGPWEFNQIVGWLQLYAEPACVCGNPWWIDAKRISPRMRKKIFYLVTPSDVLGTHFYPEDDSKTIYLKTLEKIESYAKQKRLKRRYVDLDTFRSIGPYLDWRRLIERAATK